MEVLSSPKSEHIAIIEKRLENISDVELQLLVENTCKIIIENLS